jgi:uncharacterized membrane protein YfcA
LANQLLYLLTGAIAGIFAGLLGVGGGIVVVPILNLLFSSIFPDYLLMHMAIGTSLAIMIFTAASSTYAYQRHGLIIWSLFLRFIPGMILGTITGTIIAMYLSSRTLQIAFAIFLLLVALKMFDTRKTPSNRQLPQFFGLTIAAFLTGILSGFFGIGGGTLMVPFFVYCSLIMQNATATSSACGFMLAIIGTISLIITGLPATSMPNIPYGTTGFVYWPAVLPIAITSVLFAPIGTQISVWVSPNALQYVFAVALIFTAIYLFMKS